MKDVAVVMGAILSIAAAVPFCIAVVRGKAQPNIVSWLTWTFLTAIGAAAAFASGDWQTGWIITANGIGTVAVVVLGLRFGYAKMNRLDLMCQLLALLGLLTWPFLQDPTVAVITVVIVDALAWLPTARHAFIEPYQEVWQTYALCWLGAICGLVALHELTIINSLYLFYLVIVDTILVVSILWRRHVVTVRQ